MICKIIAHRGANTRAPQNTLPAFRQAMAAGADGFETDVHLTKDGVPVICHNYSVNETSDGRGKISDYTLEQVRALDFGSYFGGDFAGTTIPTLDEFLALAVENGTEIINLELKYQHPGMEELVEKTLESVEKYGVLEKIIISSFSPRALKEVKKANPLCKTAFLYPTNRPDVARPQFNPFLTVKKIRCDIIHPMAMAVKKPIVVKAHSLGLKVNVWTVNDKTTLYRLLDFGVDGIITDCPAEMRSFADEYEKRSIKKEPLSII